MKGEEVGSAFFATLCIFKRCPGTVKIIRAIAMTLYGFKILLCTLFHLILTNILGVKFYCVHISGGDTGGSQRLNDLLKAS